MPYDYDIDPPVSEVLSGNIVKFRGDGSWHNPCDKEIKVRNAANNGWILMEEGHKVYDETTAKWYIISCKDQDVVTVQPFGSTQQSGDTDLESGCDIVLNTTKASTRTFTITVTAALVTRSISSGAMHGEFFKINGTDYGVATGSTRSRTWDEVLTFNGIANKTLQDVFLMGGGAFYTGTDYPDWYYKANVTVKVVYKGMTIYTDAYQVKMEANQSSGFHTVTR